MNSRASVSRCSVATPGTTCGISISRHSAARRPALRMPSKSAGPWILIWPVRTSASSTSSIKAMPSLRSVAPRQPARNADFLGTYVATIAQNFNTGGGCRGQASRISGIEVGAGGKVVAVGALDDEQLHGAVALGDLVRQLLQVLGRASGDAVRELGERAAAAQVDVFHLEVAGRPVRMG